MKTKSALSYFGSDSEVAESLASRLNSCHHVTIPFVGGASILPFLKSRSIVANDLNALAITFYRQMCGPHSEDLIKRCEKTLSHPEELITAQLVVNTRFFADEVMIAWAYWAICWLGRKGKGGTKHIGGKPSVRFSPEGGTNATRIKSAAADLKNWAKQFERCEWTCEDFREIIPKVKDNPKCGIYVDPPWWNAGRNYLHSFSERDHNDLAEMLSEFTRAKIVVRYDDCKQVRELYKDFKIEVHESRSQANRRLKEVCITNV